MPIAWLAGVDRHIIKSLLGRDLLGRSHLLPVRKLLWHTTEGGSIASAIGAYTARRGFFSGVHPHLTVDPRREEMVQHVPLTNASYSLRDRSDRRGVIQIEVVGHAAETESWPDSWYRWLGERVAAPIVAGFPAIDLNYWPTFYDDSSGIRLASAGSPVRLTDLEFDNWVGQIGHQHAPAPDTHWDPGEWRPGVIADAAYRLDDMIGEGVQYIHDTAGDTSFAMNDAETWIRQMDVKDTIDRKVVTIWPDFRWLAKNMVEEGVVQNIGPESIET